MGSLSAPRIRTSTDIATSKQYPWSAGPTQNLITMFGLTCSINRYYDPSTDQFLSVDPDVQTTDEPYAFVNDNPLNLEDPLGLMPSEGTSQTNAETLAIAKAYAAEEAAAMAAAAKATSQTQANSAASAAQAAAQAAQQDSELAATYLTQSSNITLNVFAPSPSSNVWNLGTDAALTASAANSSAASAVSSARNYGNNSTNFFATIGDAVFGCVIFAGATIYGSGGVALAGGPAVVATACVTGGLFTVGAG